MKPDHSIYKSILDQLGVAPRDAAFVGDGGSDELHGALTVGLRPYFASWFLDAWPQSKRRQYFSEQMQFPRATSPDDLMRLLRMDF